MNNHENVAENAASMERLRRMLVCPEMVSKRPIMERRLFALESGMDYWDTFDTLGETLFAVWRGGRPT